MNTTQLFIGWLALWFFYGVVPICIILFIRAFYVMLRRRGLTFTEWLTDSKKISNKMK